MLVKALMTEKVICCTPWFTAQDFFLSPLLEVPPLQASVERIGCRGLKR